MKLLLRVSRGAAGHVALGVLMQGESTPSLCGCLSLTDAEWGQMRKAIDGEPAAVEVVIEEKGEVYG